ncbi:MAG: hypothetical protein ACI8S7_001494 [Candidatus Krumholzibacteriia bacterium]|jgi:hypothetical protein
MTLFGKNLRTTSLWFVGFVLSVYAMALVLVDMLPRLADAGAVAVGLTLDLVVIIPVAFYFLVVRPGGHSALRVAPVVIVSMVLASLVLPAERQQVLHWLEFVVLPLEIGLVSWVVWRAVNSLKHARSDGTGDPLVQFYDTALGLFKNERVAGIFSSEVCVFYYGLCAWRKAPQSPSNALNISHHQRSGQIGIVFAFLVLLAGEGFAVHLLLAKWNAVVAWLFTASTVYAGLWLLADMRASILRPIIVGSTEIVFRAGIRQTLVVQRSLISSVSRTQPDANEFVSLSLKFAGPPSHWVCFKEPVLARGAYGVEKWVQAVGLEPDDSTACEELAPICGTKPKT